MSAGLIHGRVGETPAQRAAEAAWQRYASTCRYAGTPRQRAHAFHEALKAEARAGRLELARRQGR
jgi:hypothetical protein